MNVASLELSKELYKLSRWSGTGFEWINDYHQNKPDGAPDMKWEVTRSMSFHDQSVPSKNYPAYTAGYLLRKLPLGSFIIKHDDRYEACRPRMLGEDKAVDVFPADTPEDALTKLAIELFKQKVIKL